jgi:hypothetical protein
MLDQIEVFALPQLGNVFPEGGAPPEQLKQGIAGYWKACRVAIDRFFKTVEMALVRDAREGLRLDPSLIRDHPGESTRRRFHQIGPASNVDS